MLSREKIRLALFTGISMSLTVAGAYGARTGNSFLSIASGVILIYLVISTGGVHAD